MIGFFIGILAVIGGLTVVTLTLAAVWFLSWEHITPDVPFREAVFSIRWSYAFAFFIGPTTLVGAMEGTPILGASVGVGFVAFMVWMAWWFGPI